MSTWPRAAPRGIQDMTTQLGTAKPPHPLGSTWLVGLPAPPEPQSQHGAAYPNPERARTSDHPAINLWGG